MASAAAVHPAPASPPPAGRVVARSSLAADAVTCFFLASMWVIFWALAAWNFGLLACGDGCPVAIAAEKVFVAAGVTFALVLTFGVVPLMAWQVRAVGAAATDVEAVKAPAPVSLAAAWREALRDPVVIAVFSSMAFVLPLLVGLQVKGDSPVKGSRRERVGSVIYNVGVLGMDTVNCLFVCPLLTVRIWRAFRMA